MSNVIRAWKNEAYRQSLSAEEQALLPANPAGAVELTESELEAISGAQGFFGSNSGPSETTEQVVTYTPVFSTGTATLGAVGAAGSECDNLGSPASSGGIFSELPLF